MENSTPLLVAPSRSNVEASPATLWYAVRSKPRHERVARDHLAERGLEVFLPERKTWSRRRDRQKIFSAPMFPGYLFAGVAPGNVEGLRHARWTPGVVRILGVNGEPTPVPREDIDSLRLLIVSGEDHKPVPFVVPGNRVRVKEGPIAGAEGTVVRFGKKNRLVISVSLLQSSVSVELDDFQVEKVGD